MVDGFNFVDAHAGTAHIDSTSIARKNMIITGYSDVILPLHNRFKVTILDATHIQLWNGGGLIKGRFFYCDTYTKMEVKAGTAGLNRWDALVIRYHRGSDGVETVTPLIITGTPTSGSPSMPATLVNNDPMTGATDTDLLLGRIELNGTNLSYTTLQNDAGHLRNVAEALETARDTLTKSINDEKTLRQNADMNLQADINNLQKRANSLQDNINAVDSHAQPLHFDKLVGDSDWDVSGVVVHGVAYIAIRWANRGTFGLSAWGHTPIARINNGWNTSAEFGSYSMNNRVNGKEWFSIYGNQIDFRTAENTSVTPSWHLSTIICPVHR